MNELERVVASLQSKIEKLIHLHKKYEEENTLLLFEKNQLLTNSELQNKHIKELEIKQQQEQLALKELQAAQQAKEFERLAMVRKLQELELKTKEQQLDRTSNDLNNQKIEKS